MRLAWRSGWLAWWVVGYVGLLIGIVLAMDRQRARVVRELSTPAATAEWQAWRNDVQKEQVHPGGVARRVPKSVEPPALVLLRDYYTVSVVGAAFFTSLLYWLMAWLVTGVLWSDCRPNRES